MLTPEVRNMRSTAPSRSPEVAGSATTISRIEQHGVDLDLFQPERIVRLFTHLQFIFHVWSPLPLDSNGKLCCIGMGAGVLSEWMPLGCRVGADGPRCLVLSRQFACRK